PSQRLRHHRQLDRTGNPQHRRFLGQFHFPGRAQCRSQQAVRDPRMPATRDDPEPQILTFTQLVLLVGTAFSTHIPPAPATLPLPLPWSPISAPTSSKCSNWDNSCPILSRLVFR